jgi:hydrogenase expression/formation protein HypE
MDRIGKVPRELLAEYVLERTGADREDVSLGPRHGADFGVFEVGEAALAVATDPLFVPRELGIDHAAWYGFQVAVADASLSGKPPSHLAVNLMLPPAADGATLDGVWSVLHREAKALGASVVTGHTGRYEGCAWPYIGGVTAMVAAEPGDLILPTGAQPGDRLLVTKGPAIETVGVLAMRYGEALGVDGETLAAARERFWDISIIPDVRAAGPTGHVTAMHDATERGVDNALHELAAAGDVQLRVERDAFPMATGVQAVCDHLDIDPWRASSEGTVLMAVDADGVEEVLNALAEADVPAAAVGEVTTGRGVTVDGRQLAEPDSDPFWEAYTALDAER